MAFSLKHLSKSNRTILQTVGLFLLVIICIFLLIFATPAVQGAHRIQASFYRISQSLGSWIDDTIFARQTLRDEHALYQSIAQDRVDESAQIDALQRQVTELEQLLGYEETVTFETTLARVLSRSLTDERMLLIDKGSQDGIRDGLAVVAGNGQLIGTIGFVTDHTAYVRLLSDSQSVVAGAILGSDKTAGLVQGTRGYLLSMQYIPQTQRIAVGDTVVTSGLSERIPSGLVIGIVDELIADDAAAFQEARIVQLIADTDYSYVNVIKLP